MNHKEFQLKSSEGISLYGQCWNTENPKAIICLVHGMGEHSSRYTHVAKFFNENEFSVITYDQRGHGKSEGKRGHTPSYDLLMDDISLLLKQTDALYPGIPKFLYGHSMGGNLVLNYALRKKHLSLTSPPTPLPRRGEKGEAIGISGVISSSPWLKLAFDPPAIQVSLAKMINGIFPAFTQSSKLDATAISRDAEVVKAYQNDPLVHDKISSNMFLSIHESGLWALEHAAEFPLPLLLFHGTADRLTSYKASAEFAGKINNLTPALSKGEGESPIPNHSPQEKGAGVTFKLFKGFFHETHNEPEKGQVFQVILEWMNGKLK